MVVGCRSVVEQSNKPDGSVFEREISTPFETAAVDDGNQQPVNKFKTLRVGDPVSLLGRLLGPPTTCPPTAQCTPSSLVLRTASRTRHTHTCHSYSLESTRRFEDVGALWCICAPQKPSTSPTGTPDRDMAIKFVSKSTPNEHVPIFSPFANPPVTCRDFINDPTSWDFVQHYQRSNSIRFSLQLKIRFDLIKTQKQSW